MSEAKEPLFVAIFKGQDSAGQGIIEIRCICETCQGLTSPIHFYQKNDEVRSLPLITKNGKAMVTKEPSSQWRVLSKPKISREEFLELSCELWGEETSKGFREKLKEVFRRLGMEVNNGT